MLEQSKNDLEDLYLSVKRKTPIASNSEVLAVETIFGPPPILPGEDASAYEALLRRVSADVKPTDTIEKIWVRDVVDQTWDILRLRRIKKGLVSSGVQTALSEHLKGYVHNHPEYPQSEGSGTIAQEDIKTLCESLAERWVMKDPDVVAWVKELDGCGSFSIDEVMATAFTKELHRIERVDHLVSVAEARRNSVLREMERRRATFAQSLRGEIQQVEDAEFQVIESKSSPRKITASKKAA